MTKLDIAHKYVYGKHDALTDNQEIIDMVKDITDLIKKDRAEQLILSGVSNCAKIEDKPTPLNWLLRDKLGIEKGTTYIEPKLTVRQCASWMGEYVKKHCC